MAGRIGCEVGCRVRPGNDKEIVMAGLDPAIHAGRGRGADRFSGSRA
jgi:hypothetical protein